MKQKLIIIILVVSGFVGILINILPPQAINFLTLELTSEITNRDQVKYLTLLFVCSLFIIVFIKLIQDYLYEIYLHKKISIRHDSLYNKLLKAEPLYFQINEPNKVSHRLFTESKKVEEFLLNTYIKLPIYFISLLLFSYVLFYGVHEETPILGKYLPKGFEQNGNAFLASLILLLCPLNVFFVFFDKKIQALASSHKHLEEEVFDKTTESFQNIREIRQNNAFVLFQNKMSRYFEELRRSSLDYLSVFTLLRNLTFLTDHLSKAILLAIGVYLCIAPIDIPELSLQVPMIGWNDYLGFSAMAVLVYAYSNQIFGILLNWRENKDSLNKVNEIMDLPNIVDIRHSISNCNDIGDVRFKSVSFSKNNKSNILHDLNFDLLANKQTAIIGPSGSGKTSILNLISKESITTSGSIEVNQLNLDSISYKNWSNQLGNINQTNNLLQLSIVDNIYMGTHQTAESQKLLKETIKQISFDDDLINQAIYQPIPKAILANKDRISQLHTLKAKIEDLNVQEELFEYLEALEPQTVFSSLTLLENLSYQFSPNLSFNKSQIALIVKLIKANKPLCDMFKDTGKELSYKYGEMPSKLIQTKKYKNKNKLIKLLSPSVDWETHLYITLCLEQKVSQLYKYLNKKDLDPLILKTRSEYLKSQVSEDQNEINESTAIHYTSLVEFLFGSMLSNYISNTHQKVEQTLMPMIKKLGAEDLLISIGLKSEITQQTNQLSLGQINKIILLRALMKSPTFLILDELTSSLDERSRRKILAYLHESKPVSNIVASVHRLDELSYYDQILVLDRGKIIQQGSYSDLESKDGPFKELLNQKHASTSTWQLRNPEEKSSKISIEEAIRKSSLFKTLSASQINILEEMSEKRICLPGQILFQRNEEGDEYFFILSGAIEFYVDSENGSEIVDTFFAGGSFGELALFGQGLRTLSARASEYTELACISKQSLKEILLACPEIGLNVMSELSDRIIELRNEKYN